MRRVYSDQIYMHADAHDNQKQTAHDNQIHEHLIFNADTHASNCHIGKYIQIIKYMCMHILIFKSTHMYTETSGSR